jgi:hypothetical protein
LSTIHSGWYLLSTGGFGSKVGGDELEQAVGAKMSGGVSDGRLWPNVGGCVRRRFRALENASKWVLTAENRVEKGEKKGKMSEKWQKINEYR